MKTSKTAPQASRQENCGVWLDTGDLKEKAKKRQQFRPISKLLNPLARCGGYSLAVALNFTQTKMKMPVTKQSSISLYFAPQCKVVKSPDTSIDPTDLSPSTSTRCASTSPTPMNVGTKRKRLIGSETLWSQNTGAQTNTLQLSPKGEGAGCGWSRENVRENESADWEPYSHLLYINHESEVDEEMEEPDRKRRLSANFSPPVETDAVVEQCSQDPRSACSSPQYSQDFTETDDQVPRDNATQYSERQYALTHQELLKVKLASDSGTPFPESLQSEGGFGSRLILEGQTSTQRRPILNPWMSREGERKENDQPASFSFPEKSPPVSPVLLHKWTEPYCNSRQEHVLEQPLKEAEVDTLAMLFTQDSEGFRVIAHRDPLSRSPLKDLSNSAGVRDNRTSAITLYEEEEEMLFTQDSQGNMVIKH